MSRGPRPCPVCGEVFEPRKHSGGWTKTCSTECRREDRVARLRQHGEKGRQASAAARSRAEVVCPVCGKTNLVKPSAVGKSNGCTPACARELRRRAMSDRAGSANPNWRGGARAGVRDRAGEARWYAVDRTGCAVCGGAGGVRGIALHHVVYRQHVERAGGDVWDPRNALPVCDSCHSRHHRRSAVIALSLIPEAAWEFARETLGASAEDYLRRYYDPSAAIAATAPGGSGQTRGESHR